MLCVLNKDSITHEVYLQCSDKSFGQVRVLLQITQSLSRLEYGMESLVKIGILEKFLLTKVLLLCAECTRPFSRNGLS